ncbi:hypothetical protein [Microbacterium sp. 1.5R]|uniref:hypothetical protein n=1 Tax=Microbacterium sp. 1.5R TaxID=1916917 RepID=UPI0009F9ABDA|nr:hypothetical protein [Microbacterium sp. 1.5R]
MTSQRSARSRRIIGATVAAALLAAFGVATGTTAASAANTDCFATDLHVTQWSHANMNTLLTTTAQEAAAAAAAGYTETGYVFGASSTQLAGLVPAIHLYKPSTGEHTYVNWQNEATSAVANYGYQNLGVAFYVSPVKLSTCTDAAEIAIYGKGGIHQMAATPEQRAAAVAAGWTYGYSFHAPGLARVLNPTDADGVFSIAIMPDTQNEVLNANDTRFAERSNWLVSNRDELDLRYVGHSGDVVNWVEPGYAQYQRAEDALDPLEQAGLMYGLAIGNHDTMATGVGGSVRNAATVVADQRNTTVFNQFFTAAQMTGVQGQYEAGKVDNQFQTFEAAGKKWMVVTLELWPRLGAVAWAKQVITDHADHNVIVQTHNYLNGSLQIDGAGQSKEVWQYGNVSPQYLYDNVFSKHSNIKVVASGHTGYAGTTSVTTPSGNKIVTFLETYHSADKNPVRLVEFDVNAGTVSTNVYSPRGNVDMGDTKTVSGISFVG